jgi:RNA polymerase sigma-70 factor (ECF subfamily)
MPRTRKDEGFSAIYARFRRPLLSYIRKRITDRHVAEDLVQEVFLKAHRFEAKYEKRYAISTWLWTIAKNTVSDHLRCVGRWGGEEPIEPDELPSKARDAEESVIGRDQRRLLLKTLKSLSRPQRRVVWMRFVRQLSYDEIARKLGLSLSAVKSLAYRARISLAVSLGGEISFA